MAFENIQKGENTGKPALSPFSKKKGHTVLPLSVLSSVTNIVFILPLTTLHDSHFKVGIVLQLGSYISLTEFRPASYLLPASQLGASWDSRV